MLNNNQDRLKDIKNNFLLHDESAKFASSLGVTNPYAKINNAILEKQVEILEDAIKRYEKLEDIKKFTTLVLEDVEDITEEELKRAVEIENSGLKKDKISIDDTEDVLLLLNNEGFLDDILTDK